ncbi:protein canopy homolog 3-like [Nilaparvata lugens]|nr:protein canopy homolog 3-like [Nilaparvata lugens]
MSQKQSRHLSILLFTLLLFCEGIFSKTEEDEGVKYANKCEVCKILAIELENRLEETGKTTDVLQLQYSIDDTKPKKKKEYKKSELRLLESLENVCDRILEYNIHKERSDSTRFAKGMSQTFKTLHGLV